MTTAEKDDLMLSGISPLEIVSYDIFSCRGGKKAGCFTELRINSLELGPLYPAQYRIVTNRNNQCIRLATWVFRKLAEETVSGEGFVCFYVPAKMLLRGHLKKLLESESKKKNRELSRMVAEVSSEILYEDAEKVSEAMQDLRDTYGLRFLLSEFGDEYCPVLRLPLYPVDYVLFDSAIDTPEAMGTPAASAALRIAKQCKKAVIARIPLGNTRGELSPDYCIPALASEKRRDG